MIKKNQPTMVWLIEFESTQKIIRLLQLMYLFFGLFIQEFRNPFTLVPKQKTKTRLTTRQ